MNPTPPTPPVPIRPLASPPKAEGVRIDPASGGRADEAPRRPDGLVFILRKRTYGFLLNEFNQPIELGSGRFAKAYLGEERWVESKTAYRRQVAIKILQKGVTPEDQMRFQLEKEILERVQGHSHTIEILASGESETINFIPVSLRNRVENDYLVLELMDLSLEERLKGALNKRRHDDLLKRKPAERIFRVLEYMMPVASAIEYAHLVCDTCHRDIKPANVMLKLPDPSLRGSQLIVKLADFNVGKAVDPTMDLSLTSLQTVPGTIYFQSPEQETNSFELLVNVEHGSVEIDFFEDFYINIFENDVFSLFNRKEAYKIAGTDKQRKRIILATPFQEGSEQHVRAKITKTVGRPADIYSLGALFYYLISGAYANPKTLYDSFRKFIEYEKKEDNNTVLSYLEHEYRIIQNLRTPKTDEGGVALAPEDRFFSYKQYLDGNGELIDLTIMLIIARAMIRNKPDSYCQAWDLQTKGISAFVSDLLHLYIHYGVTPEARLAYQPDQQRLPKKESHLRRVWDRIQRALTRQKRK